MSDPRAATLLLLDHGFGGGEVRAGGPDGEIALLTVVDADRERLLGPGGAAVTREIKGLGFRYVALDLGRAPEGNA